MADDGDAPDAHADARGDKGLERRKEERRRSSSRDRKEEKRKYRSRSRSRDRRHRSRSRDRRRDRRSRSRSRDSRERRRRSRSRDGSRSWRDAPKSHAPAPAPAAPTPIDPYAHLRQAVQPAVDPLEIQRLWQEQQLRARQMVLQQQALSAKSAATKTQREVYVGNLVPGAISDVMLTQIFNTALMVRFPGSNTPGLEPVIKCNIHKDGRYAFVEFRQPDMATAALDLNGQVQFLGQAMSVNRPSGYVDPAKLTAAAAGATSTLQAFQTGALPPFAASAGLFAAPAAYPGLPAAAPAGLPLPPQLPYGMPPSAAPGAPMAAPAPAYNPAADGVSSTPTNAIRVTGMIGADLLVNDLEYAEVLEDLKSECESHAPGAVVQVKVPRPPQPELSAQLLGTGNYGRAFVLFADVGSAQKANLAINGRKFSGKVLQVDYVTQDAFLKA